MITKEIIQAVKRLLGYKEKTPAQRLAEMLRKAVENGKLDVPGVKKIEVTTNAEKTRRRNQGYKNE